MNAFKCVERCDKPSLRAALRSVDVNIRNIAGETLLHVAAGKHGTAEMAEELIRSGVDVNLQDNEGATALLFATEWKRLDVVELIVRAGGRVDVADEHGNEPLWYAVGNPQPDLGLIAYLVRVGANPTHRNEFGRSPLSIAKERGLDEIVRILEEGKREDKS